MENNSGTGSVGEREEGVNRDWKLERGTIRKGRSETKDGEGRGREYKITDYSSRATPFQNILGQESYNLRRSQDDQ